MEKVQNLEVGGYNLYAICQDLGNTCKCTFSLNLCKFLKLWKHFCFDSVNIHCPSKNKVVIWIEISKFSRVPECTEWPDYPFNRFFLPWWLGHIPRQQCQDPSASSCERVDHGDAWVSGSMRSHFHTWIGHHRVLTSTPLKVFGVKGELKQWFDSRTKMNATLDGNKYCDIA